MKKIKKKKLKRPVQYDEKGRPDRMRKRDLFPRGDNILSPLVFSFWSFLAERVSLGFCMIYWITTHDAKYHEASLLCSIILVFVGAYENFQQSWMVLFVSRACSVLRYSLATGTVQETWFYALYI